MVTNIVTPVSFTVGRSDGLLLNRVHYFTFDQLKRELKSLPDKTSYELVRLVRKHTTKERLMRLITDRIEPNTIPTMDAIANIVKSISNKYLRAEEVWS